MYEIWDFESANIVNAYPTESAALATVAAQVDAYGRAAVATWVLLRDDGGPDKQPVAEGEALANLATRQRVAVGNYVGAAKFLQHGWWRFASLHNESV